MQTSRLLGVWRTLLACAALIATHAAAAQTECPLLAGFDTHIAGSRGVFVGDMHGTEDSPEFLGALVCNVVKTGRSIALGLEYPRTEQESLDRFLKSSDKNAETTLLRGLFWRPERRDGRSSKAMLDFLNRVRMLTRDGAKIRVIAFDGFPQVGVGESDRFNARDRMMATLLNEKIGKKDSDEFKVLFAGNVHARKVKGMLFRGAPPEMEDSEPLGYLIRDWGLLHLNVRATGGTMWACIDRRCGIRTMPVNGPDSDAMSIELSAADTAYDGYYEVGHIKASPPANSP